MNSKLLKSTLLALAIGLFILWIMEFWRVGFGDSYWLAMLSLSCLLIHQYVRLRALPTQTGPTGRVPQTPAKSTKKKKK